ncbi:phage portal protein [Acidobacterium sp. S8]|uniref:phage portal protein n=1 Tax=Acidobacterium sp. S8 TaxID=1641854 RepID=UPI0020B1052C|nr:phage portal protein [Acidobacterium sp. S8]
MKNSVQKLWRRKEVSVAAAEARVAQRKTLALPSILTPYRMPSNALPKPTPVNLRRFAETPLVRRAINVLKDRIASLDWQIRLKRGFSIADVADVQERMQALRQALEEPNPADSFRTLIEQALEDALVGGFGAIEMELTGDPQKPFDLWAVDGATIQIDPKWDGKADSIRYAQTTGMPGATGQVLLRDDQLIYMRMNPRSHTPFGLGPLEVAFETVNTFLAAHRFAGNLASNAVAQYALWLNETTPMEHERLIRWWQDEIEGTGRVPILSTEQKPEVLRFASGTDADLRLNWQEFLIRMIANAFSLPLMLLGLEREVNRSTAAEQADEAFRSAVVPLAKLLAEHLTRDLFAKKLGWREFEFVFNELDAPDELTELQIQTQLLAAGVLTVNEVRSMRGLAPLALAQTTEIAGEGR